jgi:hypothetical protein
MRKAGQLLEKNAVSILSRFGVTRHLDDDNLAEIWSTAAADGRPAAHPHLAYCSHCRARYAAFTGWLDDLRDQAHAEADETFTAERLATQQAQILRRLEASERPARIIAFPKFSRQAGGTRSLAQRWVATAAAAAFVMGLAAGQALNLTHFLDRFQQASPAQARSETIPARQPGAQPGTSMDEAIFYGDADTEFAARSTRYMPTLDELTPRARDEFDRGR